MLDVDGLGDSDARALLESALAGPLDERVRDLIVAETQGNPLALLELPRGLSPAELAGGFGLPGAGSLTGRIEDSFARQLEALPDQTRRLLLLAAADPSGDRRWCGARPAAGPAYLGGGAGGGSRTGRVRQPGPVPASAGPFGGLPVRLRSSDRQRAHATLAEVTDPQADPDRGPGTGPRPQPGQTRRSPIELERSAGRAQARGGLAAAAAFLERAVLLTAVPARHADRILAAAQASMQAGEFGKALELLATAEAGPLDELASARVDLLRGQITFASGLGGDAPPLLLKAAKRLEPLDPGLARETYLSAWMAALFAGRLAGAGDLLEVCRAARALPPPAEPRTVDLVLDGLAMIVTDGPASAAPTLRRAVNAFVERRHQRGGRLPLGLAGPGGRQHLVGRRRLARRARPAGPARPRRPARSTSCRSCWVHWARPSPGVVTSRPRRP